uniref:Uncharacterized protein n=1 Tax=Vespula pensylvanica TaxID=30213 RepID=A0A834N899_VESPE|nr:hypothetical protein H0235_015639 [Vespula pensylvanica]
MGLPMGGAIELLEGTGIFVKDMIQIGDSQRWLFAPIVGRPKCDDTRSRASSWFNLSTTYENEEEEEKKEKEVEVEEEREEEKEENNEKKKEKISRFGCIAKDYRLARK